MLIDALRIIKVNTDAVIKLSTNNIDDEAKNRKLRR